MSGKKLLTKRQLKKTSKVLEYFEVTSKETKLTATFNFKSHIEALVFIARITVHAEVNQHHPDIQFSYKKVKVTLTTHEAKGLTSLDFKLAKKIESLKTV